MEGYKISLQPEEFEDSVGEIYQGFFARHACCSNLSCLLCLASPQNNIEKNTILIAEVESDDFQ